MAQKYLAASLASEDPEDALWQPVRDAVGDAVKRLRRALEDQVPRWDRPAPCQDAPRPQESRVPSSSGAPVQGNDEGHARDGRGTAPRDMRSVLLDQDVWTFTRGVVRWRDLGLEDIEATVRHYRREADGVRRKMRRLDSARAVIIQYQVRCLGEVPPEALGFLAEPDDQE
jgi:hypothetical protein